MIHRYQNIFLLLILLIIITYFLKIISKKPRYEEKYTLK